MITLKRVGIESITALQKVLDAAPTYYRNVDGTGPDPEGARSTLEEFPPNCDASSKFVFLVYEGERAVGVVDLIRGFPDANTAFLGLLLLREDCQARGLGAVVYGKVEDYAIRELGAKKIHLAVVDSNPVQLFWEKMGFKETRRVVPHHGRNRESQRRVMEKALTARISGS